ncbi:hypothetical protein LTR20_008887 [Exophiala xenobiotica]|nr:hypothetical protein LTS13_008778 [Exophiala xenobiotica]KAK5392635.1 hypothetical protein LTR79_010101 [Exophiala xenobiotica]KAK5424217.1 hypothetical protein LTR90_001563 [Exophiala xenobiotica]KAK5457536.1 hypothetical protein LTR20_008887 [Exophiala xenobiotica]KAK5474497.1 hypothetical protein LTR26_009696 [Exophiala xenobiotica]
MADQTTETLPLLPADRRYPFIIYVLGAPGSGKGTLCDELARKYHFRHISVGDWLREEVQANSGLGNSVRRYVEAGELVPDDHMKAIFVAKIQPYASWNKSAAVLIDGFPRRKSQIPNFEQADPTIVLFFKCPKDEACRRVLSRVGRANDTQAVFERRYAEFERENTAVLEYFKSAGKEVVTVDTSGQTGESWMKLLGALEKSDVWKMMLTAFEADLETVVEYQSPEGDAEEVVESRTEL